MDQTKHPYERDLDTKKVIAQNEGTLLIIHNQRSSKFECEFSITRTFVKDCKFHLL